MAEVFGVSFTSRKNFAAKFLLGEKALGAQARPGSGPQWPGLMFQSKEITA